MHLQIEMQDFDHFVEDEKKGIRFWDKACFDCYSCDAGLDNWFHVSSFYCTTQVALADIHVQKDERGNGWDIERTNSSKGVTGKVINPSLWPVNSRALEITVPPGKPGRAQFGQKNTWCAYYQKKLSFSYLLQGSPKGKLSVSINVDGKDIVLGEVSKIEPGIWQHFERTFQPYERPSNETTTTTRGWTRARLSISLLNLDRGYNAVFLLNEFKLELSPYVKNILNVWQLVPEAEA